MNDRSLTVLASIGLAVGGVLGMAGTFAPSASLPGLAWGIDGIALVLACSLLALRFFRMRQDIVAAGFLVFAIGECLLVSGAAMDLVRSAPSFGAGVGLFPTASFFRLSRPGRDVRRVDCDDTEGRCRPGRSVRVNGLQHRPAQLDCLGQM